MGILRDVENLDRMLSRVLPRIGGLQSPGSPGEGRNTGGGSSAGMPPEPSFVSVINISGFESGRGRGRNELLVRQEGA